jgi:hypothetical protein
MENDMLLSNASVLADTMMAAVETPALNPPAQTSTFTLAGQAFVAALVLFGLLTLVAIFVNSNAINLARYLILSLGLGALVVVSPLWLMIGDALRSLVVSFISLLGGQEDLGLAASGIVFLLLFGTLYLYTLRRYLSSSERKWLGGLLLSAAMFFSASYGRELAVWSMNKAGPALSPLVNLLTNFSNITVG